MSLINQMLQDLERRAKPVVNPINMLMSQQHSTGRATKNHYILYILSIFLIFVIVFGLIKSITTHKKNSSIPYYSLKNPSFLKENGGVVPTNPLVDLHTSAS